MQYRKAIFFRMTTSKVVITHHIIEQSQANHIYHPFVNQQYAYSRL